MFWRKSGRTTSEERLNEDREIQHEPIRIEPDSERPTTIVQVAAELERRGAEVVEFFKVVSNSRGQAKLPIYLRWRDQDYFVEVETRRWTDSTVHNVLRDAAVLRASEYAEAGLGMLSAYDAPEEVEFFLGKSSPALFQLAFLHTEDLKTPESVADSFVRAAQHSWNTYIDYELGSLSQVEALLMKSLYEPAKNGGTQEQPHILEDLVKGLGFYLGEVLRRSSSADGSWMNSGEWGEGLVLELEGFSLDPIGKARAFLQNGVEDSIAYYADYVLRELNAASEKPGKRDQA